MSTVQTHGSLSRFAIALVAIATIVSMSGIVYLAPLVANAQTIADGDLVRVTGTDDIYIVKLVGAKSFKRLILNPTIFDSYGHLDWGDVMDVSQATVDSYTNTNLVIEVNADGSVADPKVYAVTSAANSDVGERRHLNVSAAEFEAAGLDWDSLFNVNHTEALPSFYPTMPALTASDSLAVWATNVTGTTTPVAGTDLSVMLAGTDPASRVSAMGAQDVVFSTFNVTAGTDGPVTINTITVTRGLIGDGGIAADGNFTNVKLYRNSISPANKMGSTLTLNTTTHLVNFTNLNWTVNAGATDKLLVTGSLATSGITGNVLMLGLRSAAAFGLADSAVASGTFPAFGSKVSPATTAVGAFGLNVLDTPGNIAPLAGSTDQNVASLSFVSSSVEDFRLDSVKIRNVGTATPTDVTNLTLKYGSTVLATIPSLASDNSGTFTLVASNNENIVKLSTTRKFSVYVDVGTGTAINGRTIDIEVTQAADVTAIGQTSGGSIVIDTDGAGTAYSADSGAAHIITRGTNTAALSSAYNPSAANIIVGTEDNIATALRFSASNSEAVNITQLTITESGDSGDTDVSAVKLAEINTDGTAGAIIAEGVLTSGTVQFGTNDIQAYDSSYLFSVEKGGNKDVYVLVSIPTGATGGNEVILSIAANGDVKADGVVTQGDLAACTSCTATGNTMTITANGTLTFAAAGTTSAATYVEGSNDKEFARFTATANTGEDITLSALTLTAVSAANTPLTTANSPTDVRVYKESVSSENLLGTVAAPATGVANFSFTDVVASGTVRTYIVTGDVPTTTGATSMGFEIILEADVTATGNSSGATGTAVSAGTYSVDSNFMTIAVGHLGVIASSLPVYTNITEKSNDVEVARFVLVSGTDGETVRISSLKITLKGTAGDSLSVDAADLSSIVLYDVNGGDIAGTGVKTKLVGSLTSSAATFSGLSIDIPSGTQRVVGVKVNIGNSSRTTPYVVMGIENYYTDVAASGLDSLSTIYANQLRSAAGVNLTLTAASLATDLDLTDNITDELDDYGVPALGVAITAAGLDGAAILIESEMMIINNADTSTIHDDVTTAGTRAGFAGETAAAHSTTGVPIILVSDSTIDASGNNWSAHSGVILTAATTLAGSVRAGQLIAVHDPSDDNSEDNIKLVTAITTTGLTLTTIDAYSGTATTEDTDNDQFLVALTNYGQAQAVQAVGTITFAVASGTPKAGQIVAGTSDVEFSRVKLTALYEEINITKLVFTRTGDATAANHIGGGNDTDFASVYLQNLTDSTWGPNGNGKSNTVSLLNGKATFTFTDADALFVDHDVSSGIEVAMKGNINTTTAGVTSGDAPKFYIAALSAANITAKGNQTGTTLSAWAAGTPTPATAGNFNAQVLLKGGLDVALNSGSLSGNQTRASNQGILKLDFDSADSGSVATFRAGTVNAGTTTGTDFSPTPAGTDTDGDWVIVDGGGTDPAIAASATNRIGSAGASLLSTLAGASMSAGDGIQYSGVDLDLTDYSGMGFWLTTDQVADNYTVDLVGATAGEHTVDVSTMEADHWYFVDVPFSDATTPFTGLDNVTAFTIVYATVGAASDTFNVDDLYFYKDKVQVNLASNAGLNGTDIATEAQLSTTATLKDGSTTLATAFYSGALSATAAAELSAGSFTFIPTTQFTIPTTGKTLTVNADTTSLITGALTLSANIGLGSADDDGLVTDGDVFWYDDSFNLTDQTVRWVDSAVSPVQSGTITFQ